MRRQVNLAVEEGCASVFEGFILRLTQRLATANLTRGALSISFKGRTTCRSCPARLVGNREFPGGPHQLPIVEKNKHGNGRKVEEFRPPRRFDLPFFENVQLRFTANTVWSHSFNRSELIKYMTSEQGGGRHSVRPFLFLSRYLVL